MRSAWQSPIVRNTLRNHALLCRTSPPHEADLAGRTSRTFTHLPGAQFWRLFRDTPPLFDFGIDGTLRVPGGYILLMRCPFVLSHPDGHLLRMPRP